MVTPKNKNKTTNIETKEMAATPALGNDASQSSTADETSPGSKPPSIPQDYSDETTVRLYYEIDLLKEEVDEMMQDGVKEDDTRVLEKRKRIGETRRQITEHKETLRYRHVQQVFDELYRLPLSEADEASDKDCATCGEKLPLHSKNRHSCCGRIECYACLERFKDREVDKLVGWLFDNDEDFAELDEDDQGARVAELMRSAEGRNLAFHCVFCQRSMPASEAQRHEFLEEAAQEGRAWAQRELSDLLLGRGMDAEGLEWLHKAVAQEYAPAQVALSKRLLDQDEATALRLAKAAAYKGFASAQCVYGVLVRGKKEEEAAIMLTLSAFQGVSLAERDMGNSFSGIETVDEIESAIYWYERAALHGDAESQTQLAILLLKRAGKLFGSYAYPGYSPVPQSYRWIRRSLAGGYHKAAESCQDLENRFFSDCASCWCSEEQDGTKFLCCSKCKAVTYCSKACQKQHWRAGHRRDCCDNAESL